MLKIKNFLASISVLFPFFANMIETVINFFNEPVTNFSYSIILNNVLDFFSISYLVQSLLKFFFWFKVLVFWTDLKMFLKNCHAIRTVRNNSIAFAAEIWMHVSNVLVELQQMNFNSKIETAERTKKLYSIQFSQINFSNMWDNIIAIHIVLLMCPGFIFAKRFESCIISFNYSSFSKKICQVIMSEDSALIQIRLKVRFCIYLS